MKAARGKLDWPDDGFETLLESALVKLWIKPEHAITAGRLPPHHGDPVDRLLVAQAQAKAMTLVGGDVIFDRYGIERLW